MDMNSVIILFNSEVRCVMDAYPPQDCIKLWNELSSTCQSGVVSSN